MMSTVEQSPNASPSAVPPASISDPPPPPKVTLTPTSQPTLGTPPPATPSAPPQASGASPPRAVINAPPPATPPASNQSPPPPDGAPPPHKPTSSPPPPTSKLLPPIPSSSPPSPTTPSEPPESSTAPPPSPTTPPLSPPTDVPPSVPPPASDPPTSSPPPAVPLPGPEPPTSAPPPPPSTPPTSSTSPPSMNPPADSPPPKSDPHGSPPPPRKILPVTPPPRSPPTERPPLISPPPPSENITPSKSPPTPISAPPPPPTQPSPSPTNSSTNSSSTPFVPLAPLPYSDISPPSSKFAPDTPAKSNSTKNNGTNAAVSAGVGVSLVIIALSLIMLLVWCIVKRKKEASPNGRYVIPSPYGSSLTTDSTMKINSSAPLIQSGSEYGFDYSERKLGGSGLSIAYEELVAATDGFSPNNLLGEGGFGYVYKGYMRDGRVIAVKQLKIGSGQGEREFEAEVEIISRIHHRHLVSLVSYCVSDSRRLLVYEYVPNNTLHFHLHVVGEGRPPMDWATRVKVAAGAARGLAYLHEDCHPRVIHRDIKSSNILLSENFDARVSDFGLAKLALDANTHITTRVMGTFGYMAPEYASSGKLTEKSDVYSFGVVLLELITGRKPVDSSQPLGDESLVEWARPLLSHAIETAEFGALADPRLENNYVDAEMFRMIEAAAACVRHSATKRPRMGQVVRAFDSILPSDITNGMQMGQSEVYNSAEQSAEIRLFRKMAFGSQNYSTDYFSSDNSLSQGENNQLVQFERTQSGLHNGNMHGLERDLECNDQITEHDSHLTP